MKIAIIGSAYPYRGGLAAYNERLARQLILEGHEVTIYTFTVQYPNFLFPGKSQYSDEKGPGDLTIIRCINSINPFNWIKVGSKIKKGNFDLILIKFWLPFMGPCFGSILKLIKRNKHSRIITIIDNMIPHESRPGDKIFTKYFVSAIDGFIAMSQNVLEDINQFNTSKPKALSPHPLYDNFGDIMPREEALNKLSLDVAYQYILFFGLIRDYKGLDLLLKAFSDERLRGEKLKLIIAGEYYSDKEKYTELIKKFRLEDSIIEADKFIPDSEVSWYFNASSLVAQPYKSATQSGVTQIAYHFNKPMIVTNVGGLAEMCPDGKVGYVVEPKPDQIADAINTFFKSSDHKKMIAEIKEEKKKYSWEKLVNNIYNLMAKL